MAASGKGGRGIGGNSTKKKDFKDLTPGSQQSRLRRERMKAEGTVPLKKDGTPDRRYANKLKLVAPTDKIALPDKPEDIEKATAEEKLRELVPKNNRTEGLTVFLEEAEQEYIGLLETIKEGLLMFPDQFKIHRPDCTEEDIQALKVIADEVALLLKGRAYGKG